MIKVLPKIDAILQTVARYGSVSFTVVQGEVGFNKATLSTLMKSLVELGYLSRDGAGRFTIGDGLVGLAERRLLNGTLPGVARDVAVRLTERLGEAMTVSVTHGVERHVIVRSSPDASVVVADDVARTHDFLTTATGRVLLAYMADNERALARDAHAFPCQSWPEVDTPEKLEAALARVRAEGLAVFRHTDGLSEYVAVPVVLSDGRACAALGSSVPTFRLSTQHRNDVIAGLREGAEEIRKGLEIRGLDGKTQKERMA
jgi:DNA-binding IclR family transcriptional regulator